MKFFKPGSMMQEHRQRIKRASMEQKNCWRSQHQIFENTLGLLRKFLNEVIYESALVICKRNLSR
jgi:hypothetical protein